MFGKKKKIVQETKYMQEVLAKIKHGYGTDDECIFIAREYMKLGLMPDAIVALSEVSDSDFECVMQEFEEEIEASKDSTKILAWGAWNAYIEGDYEEAYTKFQIAYEAGDVMSAFGIGLLYFDGDYLEESLEEAAKYFDIVVETHRSLYVLKLWFPCVWGGTSASRDYKGAVESAKVLCYIEPDNAVYYRQAGDILWKDVYQDGNIQKDIFQAEKMYQKAIEGGDIDAYAEISMLRNENSMKFIKKVESNPIQLAEWFEEYAYGVEKCVEHDLSQAAHVVALTRLYGLDKFYLQSYTKAEEALDWGIEAGNEQCLVILLDNLLSVKGAFYREEEEVAALIDLWEEWGYDGTSYRKRYKKMFP